MESINLESFIGTILVAKNPCYMDDYSNQHPTLTVGKEYEIVDYRGDNDIVIVDDDGDNHLFEVNPDGSFKSFKCDVTGKTVIPFLYLFNAEPKQETSNEVGKYFADNADAIIVIERPGQSADELKLIDFLKYIKEVHTDEYGQLQICDNGDELDPTIERVVKDYLKKK